MMSLAMGASEPVKIILNWSASWPAWGSTFRDGVTAEGIEFKIAIMSDMSGSTDTILA